MKQLKNKVSITLNEVIIQCIKELSENDHRSFSQYINMVLKVIFPIQNKYCTNGNTAILCIE